MHDAGRFALAYATLACIFSTRMHIRQPSIRFHACMQSSRKRRCPYLDRTAFSGLSYSAKYRLLSLTLVRRSMILALSNRLREDAILAKHWSISQTPHVLVGHARRRLSNLTVAPRTIHRSPRLGLLRQENLPLLKGAKATDTLLFYQAKSLVSVCWNILKV